MIKELSQQGVTTLVTTHYMDEAERCDRVALINDGKILASDTPAKVSKPKEMQGVLLEIDCSRGLEILRRLPVVLDAALYGIYLHIIVDDESCAQNLRDALGQKGIEVRRIERIVPSLEDVFVAFLIEEGPDKAQGETRVIRRLWPIIRKEFLHLFRHRGSSASCSSCLLFLLVIYGYAASFDVELCRWLCSTSINRRPAGP